MKTNPKELSLKVSKLKLYGYHRYIEEKARFKASKYICFFEGAEDPVFYYSALVNSIRYNHNPIICKGKRNVIHAYEKLGLSNEIHNFLYFVDRDYDELLDNNDIYETEKYSIENYFVDSEIIEKILRNEFNLLEQNIEKCISLYTERLAEYNEALLNINAWYKTYKCYCFKYNQIAMDKSISLEKKPETSLIRINQQFIIENNCTKTNIELFYKFTILDKCFDNSVASFNPANYLNTFRGKYYMHFIEKYLEFIINDSKGNRHYTNKSINFHVSNIVSSFVKYVIYPTSLINYLEDHIIL